MKRFLSILSAIAIMALSAAFVGCGGNSNVVKDPKTLNIKVYKAGYGDSYVKGWIEKFEEMYAEEGYKINIVESNDQIQASTVMNELILGKNNPIDFYITGNCSPSALYNTSVQEETSQMIAANLDDVFASKPIKADKTEEDVTIEQKLKAGYSDYFKWDGSYYAFPYRSSPVGLVVNGDVFKKYASEYPRTTNELLEITETIKNSSSSTGVYPYAFAGYNAHSYLYGLEDVWVAQYSGAEYYANLCSLDKANSADDAADLVSDQGWIESLEVIREIQDPYNCARNSINDQHTKAQASLLNGKAVFMVTGQWLQNEMYTDYPEKAGNMEMIKTPVISALGVKLGLDGNGGQDKDKCDEILSLLVKCVDEGKTSQEAIDAAKSKGVTVTEAQYAEIKKARGIIYEWGIPFQIVINSYSDKIDVAKLFLRFIASDDAARIAFNASTSVSPFESSSLDFTSSGKYTKFISSVDDIQKESEAYIYRFQTGKRAKYQIGFFNEYQSVEKTFMVSRDLKVSEVIAKEKASIRTIWSQRIG